MSLIVRAGAEAQEVKRRKAAVKTDQVLQVLLTKTPQEIDDWFDANVTDLASARTAMKRMMRLLVYVVKQSGS